MHFRAVLCCINLFFIKEVSSIITRELFTIRTEGCTIRHFPEVSENIKRIVDAPPKTRNCSSANQLVSANSSHIWVQRDAFDLYNVFTEDNFYCCYKYLSAPTNLENVIYSDCKEFSTVITVNHEFVNIECYNLDDAIYRDYFLFKNHEKSGSNTFPSEGSYNILILGIESMSRLNFHRTMPLTSQFVKERGIVELLGYNKLGDNSFPNLFPVLMGRSFENVKHTCIIDNKLKTDKCAFIWDKFKEKGYHTALGSDSIAGLLGNYEYTLPTKPTDSYLQPFIFETRKLFKNQQYNFHPCKGTQYFYQVLLDYIYGLTQHFRLNQLFGIFWEESISHEDLNSPRIMDESYLNFLTNLHQDNYLNKTILLLLSDHGMRWGKIVRTEQGRLEERLPYLGILCPEAFRLRYKVAFQNLQRNAHRLTTPFDIYETLFDLLNPGTLEDNVIRLRDNTSDLSKSSLFLPISSLRDCNSTGIQKHWCACHRGEKIKVGNKIKTMAASNLVMLINRLLDDYPECQKLFLAQIYDVYLVESNKEWKLYTVMVKTMPGGGIFDGTLILDRTQRWAISGTVSRLNLYRNQSDCVTEASVKLYCYCD